MLDRPQSDPATHWDPFEGSVTVTPEDAGTHTPDVLPAWLDQLATPLFVIALLGFPWSMIASVKWFTWRDMFNVDDVQMAVFTKDPSHSGLGLGPNKEVSS